MLGVIFLEMLDMVEQRHSAAEVEALIAEASLPSGGAYTSVGTYPHEEMVALVSTLSRRTGIAVAVLLREFGRHLFGRLAARHPDYLAGLNDPFQVLDRLDGFIHREVNKLYAGAQMPRFRFERRSESVAELDYRSPRHLGDVALGLIEGCLTHYGVQARVERAPLAPDGERFTIVRL
jgi:hypothetical protein